MSIGVIYVLAALGASSDVKSLNVSPPSATLGPQGLSTG